MSTLATSSALPTSEKVEQEVFTHVRKATNYKETAPKQKHVRACILYTWDYKTSAGVFNSLRMLNISTDEVQCFKSLIAIHKVLREGHPIVLIEAQREKEYLESLKNYYSQNSYYGYAPLIRRYVEFLYRKLGFHKIHLEFTGSFNYEEYISIKGTTEPNEGYLTVSELMDLQDYIDDFQRSIFSTLVRGANNECRIAAIVPLVEESYGIYLFITSMLKALHGGNITGDIVELLDPLRQRYNQQFRRLQTFYMEAEKWPYLTSLITVPKLPRDPPQFIDSRYIYKQKPKQSSLQPAPPKREEPKAIDPPLLDFTQNDNPTGKTPMVSLLEVAPPQRFVENPSSPRLQADLDRLKSAYSQAQGRIHEDTDRIRALEEDIHGLRRALYEQQQNSSQNTQLTSSLQNELNHWREKYEKLSKMYAQLRQEHLALLQEHSKCGELQGSVSILQKQLRDLKVNSTRDTDETRALQAALDQSITQISQLQKQLTDKEKRIAEEVGQVQIVHTSEIESLLDKVLEGCKHTLEDSLFQLNDPTHAGYANVTAESSLTSAERTLEEGHQLTSALIGWLNRNVPVSEVVQLVMTFTSSLEDLINNAKGIRSGDIQADPSLIQTDPLLQQAQAMAKSAYNYLNTVTSKKLKTIDPPRRPVMIKDCDERVADHILTLIQILERQSAQKANAIDTNADNLADVVEREMMYAVQMIEAATNRLGDLALHSNSTKLKNPLEMQVHSSILSATKGIMDAISNLIHVATLSQKEIVAQGKGNMSPSQYYKKNHRWTEGLISGAKAVGVAALQLVETAEGVMRGTHTMEQLIVASREVTAATAQLVAAARVKALRGSRTQDNLEHAAKLIHEATQRLVLTSTKAMSQVSKADDLDLSKLSMHELKVHEMDQQVLIVSLEKKLADARRKLAEMRRSHFQIADYKTK